MTVTYIFIDDEVGSDADADFYAKAIEGASDGLLKVESHRPTSLGEVLQHIAAAKPDGVLLDVALTNAGVVLSFDGIALAQQIRTLQTRALKHGVSGLPEFPLVRFSKKDVVVEYVSGDSTSDDLFDEKIEKEDVVDRAEDAARRVASLASDYPRLAIYAQGDMSNDALAALLACDPEFVPRLGPRALLGLRRAGAPAHVLSRHVTCALLGRPGPLVDEGLLAVRLGVDRDTSPDWPSLAARMATTTYGGVFAGGYPRWWMQLVLDWWSEDVGTDAIPNRLGASERVDALRAATGLAGLAPLRPDPDSPGTRYWFTCFRSGRPVDPAFGFPLMPSYGQEGWQDTDYLCLEEARRDSRNPRLSPTERARLKAANPARAAG